MYFLLNKGEKKAQILFLQMEGIWSWEALWVVQRFQSPKACHLTTRWAQLSQIIRELTR